VPKKPGPCDRGRVVTTAGRSRLFGAATIGPDSRQGQGGDSRTVMLAALDVNGNRVRALSGAVGQAPRAVPLEGDEPDLPLVVSVEKRGLDVGRKGLALCRKSPVSVYKDFLPSLGTSYAWRSGRHQVDAAGALAFVLQQVRTKLPRCQALVLAVPEYLSREQIRLVARLAQEASLPVSGLVTRILATGLATYAQHPWHNVGVVVDIDDHALSCTVLRPRENELRLLRQSILPMLGLRVWKARLLGRIAEHCIRVCRRDPRESPEADQMVFEQLEGLLDLSSQNQPTTLHIRGHHWFQTLTLPSRDAVQACAALAWQAAEEVRAASAWGEQQMTSVTVYLTAEAARLPGLAAAIYRRCENKAPVVVVSALAPAEAAWELARRIHQGELAPAFFDPAVPLPVAESADLPPVLPFPGLRTASPPSAEGAARSDER